MFPSRCKDEAHICNSNFDMRRFCPKTCEDCGEGIFSLKTFANPDKKHIGNHTYEFPNTTILISECLSNDDCPLDNKPFCTNGICTGIKDHRARKNILNIIFYLVPR